MKQDSTRPNQWDICPPGLLQETARQGPVNSIWMLAAGLLIGAGLVGLTLVALKTPEPAIQAQVNDTIKCCEIREGLRNYVENGIPDCATRKLVCNHLMECCDCRAAYKQACDEACRKKTRPKDPILKSNKIPDRSP